MSHRQRRPRQAGSTDPRSTSHPPHWSTYSTTASPADGESRYRRPAAHGDTDPSVERGIEVVTPCEPPRLTSGAARVLLRILCQAARRQGVLPPDIDDV